MSVGVNEPARIVVLDAFRGIAVLGVVLFHFAYYWTPAGNGLNLTPYGDALAWIPLADVGYLGVTLFFLISGYVISLTLSKTKSLHTFTAKRFARLWPTLFFCGSLTYLATLVIGEEALQVSFPEYVVSIVFLPPQHVGRVLGQTDWQWLDGAYWSLWVEVRFYAVIGVLFYMFRKSWFILWLAFEVFGWLIATAALLTGGAALGLAEGLLFSYYTPFFTLGIVAYRFHQDGLKPVDVAAIAIAMAHGIFTVLAVDQSASPWSLLVGYGILSALFGAFVISPKRLTFLESRWLLKVGRSSYSLYLLHQVLGLSIMAFVAQHMPHGQWIALLVTIPLLFGLAHFSFVNVEAPSNRWFVKSLAPA